MLTEAMPEPIRLLGVDLGQQQDYTALSVLERHYIPVGSPFNEEPYRDEAGRMVYGARQPVEREYRVRHLERPELRTPYTQIVDRIIELARLLETRRPFILLDETGVGRPVRDLLRAKLKETMAGTGEVFRPKLLPITITGRDLPTRSPDGGFRVPKRDIAAAVLVLMQNGMLKIAEGLALKDVLVQELQNFRVKINIATGHDGYEARRENEHDDIVLAVALACWAGERMPNLTSIRLPGTIAADGISPLPMPGAQSAALRVRRW